MALPSTRVLETDVSSAAFNLQHDDSQDHSGYTRQHRDAWNVMVRGPDAESLVPAELSSWLRLWGRLGADLFRCFRDGDAFIRSDMIALARNAGGWRGEIIADRLDGWRRQLLDA